MKNFSLTKKKIKALDDEIDDYYKELIENE